jgi:two-component system, OmpR family, response regulator RpaA
MRILVVDDSAVVRRLVTARLEADGHEVVEATDGMAGLEAALAEPPDLVVLDRSMPRMDGFEVCTRLREQEETADVAILMLTDSSSEQALAEGIDRGADDFMSKPFSPRELSLRVRLLGSRRALP